MSRSVFIGASSFCSASLGPASAAAWSACAPSGPPSRSDRPVWRRKTSSRVGSDMAIDRSRRARRRAAGAARGSAVPPSSTYSRTRPSRAASSRTYGSRASTGARAPRSLLAVPEADHDRVAGHLALQRARGALGHDLAVVDDHEAIAQRVRLFQVVGGEEHRGAAVAQPADVIPQVRPALRVEPGRRLVEEQHRGLVHQAERDVEAAALTAGVGADPAVGELGEIEQLEQGRDARQHLVRCARRTAGPAAAGSPGQWRARRRRRAGSRSRSGPRTSCGCRATSKPATVAVPESIGSSVVSIRSVVVLPGPVRAEEAEDLARPDVDADAAHRLDGAAPARGSSCAGPAS